MIFVERKAEKGTDREKEGRMRRRKDTRNRNGCRNGGRKGMSFCKILNTPLFYKNHLNIGLVFVWQAIKLVKESKRPRENQHFALDVCSQSKPTSNEMIRADKDVHCVWIRNPCLAVSNERLTADVGRAHGLPGS